MNQTDIRQSLMTLKVVYAALIFGQLTFTGIVLYLVYSGNSPLMTDLHDAALMVALVSALGTLFAGNTVFKQRLRAIPAKDALIEKLSAYKAILIMKLAIWESSVFISIVALFLTANYLILIAIAIIISSYLLSNPSPARIASDLNLNDAEKELLFQAANEKIGY